VHRILTRPSTISSVHGRVRRLKEPGQPLVRREGPAGDLARPVEGACPCLWIDVKPRQRVRAGDLRPVLAQEDIERRTL
jgi:hypothetical protein